jgi:hypothetical protein
MVPVRYRALKAGDSLATLGLIWLSWRFLAGDVHWKLAIAAVVLSGAWLALTALRMNRLFTTYFDILSRLEFVLPCGLGMALAFFAALDTHYTATRVVAGTLLVAWGDRKSQIHRLASGFLVGQSIGSSTSSGTLGLPCGTGAWPCGTGGQLCGTAD